MQLAGGDEMVEEYVADAAYETVPFEDIAARRGEFDELFGQCNKKFMLGAAALYAGFAALDTTFDISRLRSEGMGASPRFSGVPRGLRGELLPPDDRRAGSDRLRLSTRPG